MPNMLRTGKTSYLLLLMSTYVVVGYVMCVCVCVCVCVVLSAQARWGHW